MKCKLKRNESSTDMFFELVLFVCINTCEPVVFEPPAHFETEAECHGKATEYHIWVAEAVREEHKDHGHPANWVFTTKHECQLDLTGKPGDFR